MREKSVYLHFLESQRSKLQSMAALSNLIPIDRSMRPKFSEHGGNTVVLRLR
jgi:hypothetical protein